MARNTIVLKGQGHFEEYAAADGVTLKPGLGVHLDSDGKLALGISGANGERGLTMIVVEDANLGMKPTDSYAAAAPNVRVYCPVAGDELQVLVSDTADAVVIGDKLINVAADGEFIETTGTVESEPFVALEAPGTLSADTLVLVKATGM